MNNEQCQRHASETLLPQQPQKQENANKADSQNFTPLKLSIKEGSLILMMEENQNFEEDYKITDNQDPINFEKRKSLHSDSLTSKIDEYRKQYHSCCDQTERLQKKEEISIRQQQEGKGESQNDFSKSQESVQVPQQQAVRCQMKEAEQNASDDDISYQFLRILKEAEIVDCKEIDFYWKFFKKRDIQDLKKSVDKKIHLTFFESLYKLLDKTQQKDLKQQKSQNNNFENELIQILKQAGIDNQTHIIACLQLVEAKKYQWIKQQPNKSHLKKTDVLQDKFLEVKIKCQQKQLEKPPQKESSKFDIINELKPLLREMEIEEEQKIQEVLTLFQQRDIESLKKIVPEKHKQKISSLLDGLIEKISNVNTQTEGIQPSLIQKTEENVQDCLIKLLGNVGIVDQDIDSCLALFQEDNIEELKLYPSPKYRKQFSLEVDKLIQHQSYIKKHQKINVLQELTSLLSEVQIIDDSKIKQCYQLLEDDNIYELQVVCALQHRERFGQSLENLMMRIAKSKEVNVKKEVKSIFRKVQIYDEQQLSEGMELLEKGDIESILGFTNRKNRGLLKQLLLNLIEKIQKNKVKIKSLSQILTECKIRPQFHEGCLADLEKGNFAFLLEMPQKERKKLLRFADSKYKMGKCSMQIKLKVSLSRCLTDKQISEIVSRMKERKDWTENIPNRIVRMVEAIADEYRIVIYLRFLMNKQKDITLNQLAISHQKFSLGSIIEEATELSLNQMEAFVGGERVSLTQLNVASKQEHTITLKIRKTYICRYNGKQREVCLLPQQSIKYIKQLILAELLQKKDIECNEKQPFDFERMNLTLETQSNEQSVCNDGTNIFQFEEKKGVLLSINVSIKLKVVLCFKEIKSLLYLQSSSILKNLKEFIKKKYIPWDFQLIHLSGSQEFVRLEEANNNQQLWEITSKSTIVFKLIDKRSLQFYGFRRNVPLCFEQYIELFYQDEKTTRRAIESCSFFEQSEEEQFIQHFFCHLFFGIKRGFSIKAIIDKFRLLVSQIKRILIWSPIQQEETAKVNESFVVCYMLRNADLRLRVELMRVLRSSTTIPLFTKPFQNIIQPSNQCDLQLNQELVWVLQESFTIASIGLHTNNSQHENGKSDLLNEIFLTNFENIQNKHFLVKQLPFIALNVFQNLYPMHIIDVPRDSPKTIRAQILENVNMIILHSWASKAQTEENLQRLQECYKVPIVCLMRDDKDKSNGLQNLSQGCIAEGKPQKIINLSNKDSAKCEISLLKEKIFKFIQLNLKKYSNCNKIIGLFERNQAFMKVSQVLALIKQKIFNLSPINHKFSRKKDKQKNMNQNQRINQTSKANQLSINLQITQFLQILMASQNLFKNLLLIFFRERLTAYHNQLQCKLIKIYHLKKYFESIKEIKNQQKNSELKKLNFELTKLNQLKPEDIIGKNEEEISIIIENMIKTYETIIKPNIFCVQLFQRELNYLATINTNHKIGIYQILDTLQNLKMIQINNCIPFEIINADQMQMSKTIMMKMFENKQDRAVVVSILGNQTLNNSALLNFLFGCSFDSSERRFTNGILGTYFKFAKNKGEFSNITHCQRIFVINNQGMYSTTNSKDKQIDKTHDQQFKLAFFCFGVSDFVIINISGELHPKTEKIIRLCNERLEDLGIQKENQPEIILLLSQLSSSQKEQYIIQFKNIKRNKQFDINKYISETCQMKRLKRKNKSSLLSKQNILEIVQESTKLFRQILKPRSSAKLSDIIAKLKRVWDTVASFTNISKVRTNKYKKLQLEIKKWKMNLQKHQQIEISKRLSEFKENSQIQNQILQEIKINENKKILLFDQTFEEKLQDEEEIRSLIRQERSKISYQAILITTRTKEELAAIKLKKTIKIQKINGKFIFVQEHKKYINHIIDLSEQQKKTIFDQYYNEHIQNIELRKKIEATCKIHKIIFNFLLQFQADSINWIVIQQDILSIKMTNSQPSMINKNFTIFVNQKLRVLNLKITSIDWKKYFTEDKKANTQFQVVQEPPIINSEKQFFTLVEKIQFVSPLQFENTLKKTKQKSCTQGDLSLFTISATNLASAQNKKNFRSILKDHRQINFEITNNKQFQVFIFDQLKQNKKSFDKLFSNIFDIIKSMVTSCKKVQKKTLIQIFKHVYQQVSKFNNDLAQIYCTLANKYVAYLSLAVVYMIWKLIIDKKADQNREIYSAKKKQYESEWQIFVRQTSKHN